MSVLEVRGQGVSESVLSQEEVPTRLKLLHVRGQESGNRIRFREFV